MYRSDADDRAPALRAALAEALEQSFRNCPEPVHQLRSPWLGPCTLAEHHTVDGALRSLTLAYGPWDTDQPHIRVTTWRDPAGAGAAAEDLPGFEAAEPEEVTVDIAGAATPGTLLRAAGGAWLLRVDRDPLHLLASGRGPLGDLAFDPLTDLAPVVEARRAYLAARFPDA